MTRPDRDRTRYRWRLQGLVPAPREGSRFDYYGASLEQSNRDGDTELIGGIGQTPVDGDHGGRAFGGDSDIQTVVDRDVVPPGPGGAQEQCIGKHVFDGECGGGVGGGLGVVELQLLAQYGFVQ